MAKDKSEKKEKKEKKLAEENGVKKEKKEKEKKSRKSDVSVTAALNELEAQTPGSVAIDADGDVIVVDAGAEPKARLVIPAEALVPFANPLADDKQTKKVLKGVKKAAKNKTLKRGVKEVVKSLRKTPKNAPSSSNLADPAGIVILAADISPMDVISHLPVLCEDHNVPYIYVTSRAELGAAGNTKRPTSVVMISKERTGKAGKALEKTEEAEEFEEAYTDLLKLVRKAGATVRV